MATFLYTPSDWGARYHNCRYDEVLGAGSAGPGKTQVLLMDPMGIAAVEHERCANKQHPFHQPMGSSTAWVLYLRRIGRSLDQVIARCQRIFPSIDPGVRWDASNRRFVFSSGMRYDFGHCKDPDDWQAYLSNEYTRIMFDELVEFERDQYEQIKMRCRSSDPVLRTLLGVRAMSNPVMRREAGDQFTVKDPHWVRRYFVDPAPQGNTVLARTLTMEDGTKEKHTRIYLPARLSDNPDKAFVRDYEKRLQGALPHIKQALLYGDWYVTPDSFYASAWNPSIHVCEPFQVPREWTMFRSMDWGFKKPGCVHWWAIDYDDNLIGVHEFTFQGKTEAEVADEIRAIEERLGCWRGKSSRITGPADTQIWEERGDSGVTKAAMFASKGVGWRQATKNSAMGNRRSNSERLLKRLQDHNYGTTRPGIVFFSTCRHAIRTIPAIQTDPHDVTVPLDGGEDHWHDSVLYACAYASYGRRVLGRETRPVDDDDDDKRPDFGHRGRYGYGSREA